MKEPIEIYKAIDTEFTMGAPNSLVNRKCETGQDVIVYAMKEYAKQYHKYHLKLLGISGVNQGEQLQARDRLLDFAYNNCKEEDLKYLNEIRDSL